MLQKMHTPVVKPHHEVRLMATVLPQHPGL